jgi:hypothetical protein
MRTKQYLWAERAVIKADGAGIRERWLWGLRLLHDPEVVSDSGRLKHGVIEQLITAADEHGMRLSRREIQRRLQCARAYPYESQLRHAMAQFGTWYDLQVANFPSYEPEPGEEPADWRTDAERKEAEPTMEKLRLHFTQLAIPGLEPDTSTLGDFAEYVKRERRRVNDDDLRVRAMEDYRDRMIEAVNGDMTVLWRVADEAAYQQEATA